MGGVILEQGFHLPVLLIRLDRQLLARDLHLLDLLLQLLPHLLAQQPMLELLLPQVLIDQRSQNSSNQGYPCDHQEQGLRILVCFSNERHQNQT